MCLLPPEHQGSLKGGPMGFLFCQVFVKTKEVHSNKRTIKVCYSCCWRPETSAPNPARLTVVLALFLCSFKSKAQGDSKALEGCCVSSKSLLRVQDGNGRKYPEEWKRKLLSGHWFGLLANQLFFSYLPPSPHAWLLAPSREWLMAKVHSLFRKLLSEVHLV